MIDPTNIILITCFDRSEINHPPPFVFTIYRKGGIRDVHEFQTKKARIEAVNQVQQERESAATHFVGFRNTRQFANAVKVFGQPDFIHRWWDRRAEAEIMPCDIVIHAKDEKMHEFVYDDSAHF